jgi:hypothetical protein
MLSQGRVFDFFVGSITVFVVLTLFRPRKRVQRKNSVVDALMGWRRLRETERDDEGAGPWQLIPQTAIPHPVQSGNHMKKNGHPHNLALIMVCIPFFLERHILFKTKQTKKKMEQKSLQII